MAECLSVVRTLQSERPIVPPLRDVQVTATLDATVESITVATAHERVLAHERVDSVKRSSVRGKRNCCEALDTQESYPNFTDVLTRCYFPSD